MIAEDIDIWEDITGSELTAKLCTRYTTLSLPFCMQNPSSKKVNDTL